MPSFLELLQNPQVLLTFGKVQNPLHLPRKITSEPSQVVRACGVFNILTWKCASRHNRIHFFNISTSKSAPQPSVFYTFDFEMCFAPQRCALFRHLNFQKWFEHGVLCAFWLPNVLCATTACNFSSLIWPDGSAPALKRAYFSTLRSHKSLEKRSVPRVSHLFAHLDLLSSEPVFFLDLLSSSLLFSSLTLPISLFHLSILSEVWLLNFLRWVLPAWRELLTISRSVAGSELRNGVPRIPGVGGVGFKLELLNLCKTFTPKV